MEKTLLIAGKESPDGNEFASKAALKDRNVVITTGSDKKSVSQGPIESECTKILWSRSSPVSARSLVLGCENKYGSIDEAVLYFDEPWYSQQFELFGVEVCTRALDVMIAGYQYLAMEILGRFEQKRLGNSELKPGKLVFLHKTNPSVYNAIHLPSVRAQTSVLSSPFVAAAAAAFDRFAENCAAVTSERTYVQTILVSAEKSNEVAQKDSLLASWLCDYLDQLDVMKSGLSPKQMGSWVKAGQKSPHRMFSDLTGALKVFR